MKLLKKILEITWRWFVGAAVCLTVPGAMMAIGWSYRLARREIFCNWDGNFDRDLPNWFVRQGTPLSFSPSSIFHSLWQNFTIGFQGLLNTWVLTLPGCVLWLFAWHSGWNNSFFKGYEQAFVGPATGMFGVALFSLAMLYVPMAQIRQASTGQWRCFYDYQIILNLIRRRWLACLGLAGAYSLLSIPVMFLKTYPMFLPNNHPELLSLSDSELYGYLEDYFFGASLVVFAIFVTLRIFAAKIYAIGVIALIQDGTIPVEKLAHDERIVLGDSIFSDVKSVSQKLWIVRVANWAATKTGRFVSTAAILALWAFFSFQILVSEFLNYHPRIGFLNQPLVHAPYFSYIPQQLRENIKHRGQKMEDSIDFNEEK